MILVCYFLLEDTKVIKLCCGSYGVNDYITLVTNFAV